MPRSITVDHEPVTINTWSVEAWGPGLFRVHGVVTFNESGTYVFAAGHRLMSGKLNSWAYQAVEIRGHAGDRLPVSLQYSMDGNHTSTCGVFKSIRDIPTAYSFQAVVGMLFGAVLATAVAGAGLLALAVKGIK